MVQGLQRIASHVQVTQDHTISKLLLVNLHHLLSLFVNLHSYHFK